MSKRKAEPEPATEWFCTWCPDRHICGRNKMFYHTVENEVTWMALNHRMSAAHDDELDETEQEARAIHARHSGRS